MIIGRKREKERKEEQEEDGENPVLTGRDRESKYIFTNVMPNKGANEHAIKIDLKLGCCSHVVLQDGVRGTPHRDMAPSGLNQFSKLRKSVQVLHRGGDIPNILFDLAVFKDKITKVFVSQAMNIIWVDHIQNRDRC